MALEVYRFTRKDQVGALLPLVAQFHRRNPGLRYTEMWSRSQLTAACERPADMVVLAAYDDERTDAAHEGFLGYLWAQGDATGELFIFQMMSLVMEAGRALTEALLHISDEYHVKNWNGLITLRPGEASRILEQLPRIRTLAGRFHAAPESVWLTRRLHVSDGH